MKRSGLNIINASFFLIIAIANIVDCALTKSPLWEYFAYGLPLIAAAAAIYILKKKITPKITAGIFLAFSILSIAFGDHGNLTGAVFFCFGIYTFKSHKIATIGIVLTALAILGKAVITPYTIPQTVNFIAGYFYIVSVFYVLIMRQDIPRVGSDPDDYEIAEIVKMLINGLSYKEIADRMDVSASAISKRLERVRGRMGAKSNEHLAILMSRNGQIVIE